MSTNPAVNTSTNPDTDETESLRAKLRANGWHWLPGQGKGIYYDGWNKGEYDYDVAEFQASENPKWSNTGILCGLTIARDVDAKVTSTAAKLAEPELLGESSCGTRYGSKGSATLYRVAAPMRSITVRGIAPGDTKKSTIVEYIGMARQLMCFGIHPDTGKPYSWEGKSPLEVPTSELTKYSRDDFMAQAVRDKEIAIADGWTEVTISIQATDSDKIESRQGDGGLVDRAMLEKMLSKIDPDCSRSEWITVLGALRYAEACELVSDPQTFEPDSEFDYEAVAIEWSRGDYWKDGKQTIASFKGEDVVSHDFETLYPFKNGGSTFGSIVAKAREGGYKGDSRIDDMLSRFLLTHEDDLESTSDNGGQVKDLVSFDRLYNPWTEYLAPIFPLDTLPSTMRDFVVTTAENRGGDVSAFAACCLYAMSVALTQEATLYLKPGNNFPVSGRLWWLLVGDVSSRKTPLQKAALARLGEIDSKRCDDHDAKVRAITEDETKSKEEKKVALSLLQREAPAQFIANDLTIEKLANILSHQNRGIGIHRDEIAGWIGSFEKYGGKGAGNSDRAFFLQAYDGGEFRVQRMSRDQDRVKNLSLSFLGGIQPDRLKDFKGLEGDGLLQRFLPVMMRSSTVEKIEFNNEATHGWNSLIDRLVDNPAIKVHLSPEAFKEYWRISTSLAQAVKNPAASTATKGFLGKLNGVWGSLALLLHVAWDEKAVNQVSEKTAKMASRILEKFIIPHGWVFYLAMAEDVQRDDRAIATCIIEHLAEGHSSIRTRDFQRGTKCCREKGTRLPDKLMSFTSTGWLIPENDLYSCNSWEINPAVAGFGPQAVEFRKWVNEIQETIKSSAAELAGKGN